MSREPYWYRSAPNRPWEIGDHVITKGVPFQGVIDDIRGSMYVIRIDKPHNHFRDTIFSQGDELQLFRDSEIERAQKEDDRLTGEIDRKHELLRSTMASLFELGEDRAAARRRLREAKRLPVKADAS